MGFDIGADCQIHPTAIINVKEGSLGPRSIIREGARIEGRYVVLGTETYMDMRARIGGGSCFGPLSNLIAGDWLHMGVGSHINTARAVSIGDEVGIGVETKVWTHGAYLPVDEGFPTQWDVVTIGDRVWLPNAWVNPGVYIGKYTVVAAMSLVNQHLPMGCLAGGIPAKVLKKDIYPKRMSNSMRRIHFHSIYSMAEAIAGGKYPCQSTGDIAFDIDYETHFDIKHRTITGKVTKFTEILKNELRRNGIRFKFYAKDGEYVPW
ncbi:MAG: acyltransferase [Candidatus Thorarchaeota archaeon]